MIPLNEEALAAATNALKALNPLTMSASGVAKAGVEAYLKALPVSPDIEALCKEAADMLEYGYSDVPVAGYSTVPPPVAELIKNLVYSLKLAVSFNGFLRGRLQAKILNDPDLETEARPALVNEPSDAYCSFCGKSKDNVKTLVAGPNVYICDECVCHCFAHLPPDSTSAVFLPFERWAVIFDVGKGSYLARKAQGEYVKYAEVIVFIQQLQTRSKGFAESLFETQKAQHRLDVQREEMLDEFVRLRRDRNIAEGELAEVRTSRDQAVDYWKAAENEKAELMVALNAAEALVVELRGKGGDTNA